MSAPSTRLLLLPLAAALALGLGACAKSVSTSAFKGEQHEVAQTISNLQSDVSAGEEKKICEHDLAGALVAQLNTLHGGCKQVIKDQLAEIDNFDLSVESVTIGGTAAKPTATAQVKSGYAGKSRSSTLHLVREGGKWKVAGLE